MTTKTAAMVSVPSRILLREDEVRVIIPVGRSTIYDWIRDEIFPEGIKLGPRCTAWLQNEVIAIREARIRGDSTDQIKTLVKKFNQARKGKEQS
jgi:prophage regulatory protein